MCMDSNNKTYGISWHNYLKHINLYCDIMKQTKMILMCMVAYMHTPWYQGWVYDRHKLVVNTLLKSDTIVNCCKPIFCYFSI